jgi:hypothetical protein
MSVALARYHFEGLPNFRPGASALINRETGGFLFGVLTAAGFMSLGYAVRTAADAR